MLPNKKPTAHTAFVLLMPVNVVWGAWKAPRINKLFSDIAGRRVFVYLMSTFSPVLDDIDGLMTDAFGI